MTQRNNYLFGTVIACTVLLIQTTTFGQICLDPQIPVPSGVDANHVAACDFNGDGQIDLASPNSAGNAAMVMMNTGNGTFASPVSYPIGADPDGITCADFDGINGPDLALTSSNNNTFRVSILLNTGSGTFLPPVVYTLGAKARQVIAADLDGDNDQDLAIVLRDVGAIATLLNNGNGTFASPVQHAVGVDPRWVIACDIEADADLDLIVSNNDSGTVSVLVNQGLGNFAGQVTYATGQNPQGLACCDVDNDNDADLVVAAGNNNSVAILANNGAGQFSAPVYWPAGIDPDGVACCDLDADGLQDIVVSDNTANTIYVLRNLGAATFAFPLQFATGLEPSQVVCEDLDGDGGPDVVVANSADSIVSVFYNCTANPLVVEAFATKFLDGVVFAGTVADAGSSDDVYYELDPSATLNPFKQRIEMILLSEIAVPDPVTFNFRLEAAMAGGPVGDVTQTIEMWDEMLKEWEVVDVRMATDVDTVVEVSPLGDLSRFVHPVTGEVLTKITWASLAFGDVPFFWSIDVDQAVWVIE